MAGRRIAAGGTLVLDSEGLSKLASGDFRARAHLETARVRRARVVVSAVTLTEVLRGGSRDALVHRVLSRIVVAPVSPELGRAAGELLGTTGLSGHRGAIDAIVAATALQQPRPVVLLTSDPDDMNSLVEEPGSAKEHRVVVVHV
ncbi:putative nucleic acid-binding protein [Kibdelosporangium banguiense]|uniref:Nucleic acid-binding protein n=1 Tax=Kibdelosporangium banguiense TaxID=1365924 RepID=A0ABS4T9B2_9PSEU|nr:PIN domain-containing protein [Kibdelosporangium banguiense]MBP2320916.1 putative nucleic acid-binding protein [Kibdelosporangium banguiense]